MNSVITDMYAKKSQTAGTGNTASVKEKPVVPTSSGLSYSIDRTGSQVSDALFQSDQRQQSGTESDSVTVCEVSATAGTDGDSAADVIIIEDNCESEENSRTCTNAQVPSAAPVVHKRCSPEKKLTVTQVQFMSIVS